MRWTMVGVTLVLVAPVMLLSGCGAVGSAPKPPPNYQPVMPPGGDYGSAASDVGARQRGLQPGAPAQPGR